MWVARTEMVVDVTLKSDNGIEVTIDNARVYINCPSQKEPRRVYLTHEDWLWLQEAYRKAQVILSDAP